MINGFNKRISTLKLIARNAYPAASPRNLSLIERIASIVVTSLSLVSFANVRNSRSSKNFMDIYVLVFAGALTALLIFHAIVGEQRLLRHIVSFLAIYRIADIASYRAYFLLVKSRDEPWTNENIRRSVVIVAVNFYEVVVAFSLLYTIFPFFGPCPPQEICSPRSLDTMEAVYFSFVTMLTVGYGDITPVTALGRFVVVTQLATTMLFIVFLLPALVGVFSPELTFSEKSAKSTDANTSGSGHGTDYGNGG